MSLVNVTSAAGARGRWALGTTEAAKTIRTAATAVKPRNTPHAPASYRVAHRAVDLSVARRNLRRIASSHRQREAPVLAGSANDISVVPDGISTCCRPSSM